MNEKEVFQAVVDLPHAERATYLDKVCGKDTALRSGVERLLKIHDKQGSFLDVPAIAASVGISEIGEGIGSIIGSYTLLEVLGEGGMGIVFRARQGEPVEREVALKVIKPGLDTREVISRFRGEQQALAVMNHPNVAKVLDAGTTDPGRPFFVMELVEGQPITDFCDHQRLDIQQRLELFIQVCLAIQHAHSKSIVHRDVKPTNVLVAMEDGKPVPKVIDFGIAKATSGSELQRSMLTRFSQVLGTPLYMSPEQADPDGTDIDTRTDVYSLGVLLYELLTGTTPFDKECLLRASYDEVRRIIREEETAKPSDKISTHGKAAQDASTARGTDPARLHQRLRGDLDCITMKALEKDRNRRYETVSSLAEDIRRFLNHEAVLASPPSRVYRLKRMVARNRAAFAFASLIVITLVAGIAGTSWGWRQAARANQALAESLKNEERERRNSETQTEVAQAISGFLNDDLLASVVPSAQSGKGHNVTVREVLDESSKRIKLASQPGGRFHDKPQVEANIRFILGRTYHQLGLPQVALPHLERAEELRTDHPELLEELRLLIMESTANTLDALGELTRAEALKRDLIAAREKLHGPDGEPVLMAMFNLASSYGSRGQFEEARNLLQDVAARRTRTLGAGHPKTLQTRAGETNMLMRLGKNGEALKLLQTLLELARQADDPEPLMQILINLGQASMAQKDYVHAEQYIQEAIQLRTEYYGPKHPVTTAAIGNLGSLALEQNKWQEAYDNLSIVLESARERFGPTAPLTVVTKNNLSLALVQLEKLEEAEELLVADLDAASQSLGHDHFWIRSAFNKLSWIADGYAQKDRSTDALRVHQRVMEYFIALAERESPTASDLHAAAVALSETPHDSLRDIPQAVVYAQQAVDIEAANGGSQLDAMRETLRQLQAWSSPKE